VHRRQELVFVAEVVLAELAGRVAERLEGFGDIMSSARRPRSAPGRPTLERPVRSVACPVMNDERPAVQLCSA
jgi:hypothetical protein